MYILMRNEVSVFRKASSRKIKDKKTDLIYYSTLVNLCVGCARIQTDKNYETEYFQLAKVFRLKETMANMKNSILNTAACRPGVYYTEF